MNIFGKWESVQGEFLNGVEQVMLDFEDGQVRVYEKELGDEEFKERGVAPYSFQEGAEKSELYFNFFSVRKSEFTVYYDDERHLVLKDKQQVLVFERVRG